MEATVGDVIEVQSNKVGGTVRRGKVLEIVDHEGPELRVEWEDGHESILYPSGGMTRVVRSSG